VELLWTLVADALDLDLALQDLVDHCASAIFVKDADGRYVTVNHAFLRPLGLRRDQVIGRTPAELWPSALPMQDRDERIFQKGVVETTDDVVDLEDGSHTLMTVRFPLRDGEGHVEAVAAIATDVTDRQRVETALHGREHLLDTILEASPDIVTVLDERGRVSAVSAASLEILGYDHSSPVHEQLESLVHPDDRAAAYDAYRRLFTGGAVSLNVRYRVRHANGEWVVLEARAQSIVDDNGKVTGAVVVSRDVTANLGYEEDLHSALSAAERASSAKSEFLSRMSHELRNPLNSVLGFAQLLEMEDLHPSHSEAVRQVLSAGRHLVDLVDEVLEVARIESGRLDPYFQRAWLDQVVDESIDSVRPLAVHRGVEIQRRSEHEVVVVDRQRLVQVLENLLSNAVKYNFVGGTVDVAAWVVPADDTFVLSVSDTGRGIPPEGLDLMFEPFERLGAERGGVGGTGLGLTLCKHLVDRLGGRLYVESEVGVGTTFTVTLPRRTEDLGR
jgi:PAS domain S-box-containing protein